MWGMAVAMTLFLVANEEWKWYNQMNKSVFGGNLNMDAKTDSWNVARKRWYFFAIF